MTRTAREYLIGLGIDIDAQDVHGGTALEAAAGAGSKACVDALLAKGCMVDPTGYLGRTPAMVAAMRGSADCLASLIAAGCDVSKKCAKGHSVMDYANGSVGRKAYPACMALIAGAASKKKAAP